MTEDEAQNNLLGRIVKLLQEIINDYEGFTFETFTRPKLEKDPKWQPSGTSDFYPLVHIVNGKLEMTDSDEARQSPTGLKAAVMQFEYNRGKLRGSECPANLNAIQRLVSLTVKIARYFPCEYYLDFDESETGEPKRRLTALIGASTDIEPFVWTIKNPCRLIVLAENLLSAEIQFKIERLNDTLRLYGSFEEVVRERYRLRRISRATQATKANPVQPTKESTPEPPVPKDRASIVRRIMKSPKDFKDHDKVLELAKALDEAAEPMLVFRARRPSQVVMNPPKTYSEIAKNKKHKLYSKAFDHRDGVFVKDIRKK